MCVCVCVCVCVFQYSMTLCASKREFHERRELPGRARSAANGDSPISPNISFVQSYGNNRPIKDALSPAAASVDPVSGQRGSIQLSNLFSALVSTAFFHSRIIGFSIEMHREFALPLPLLQLPTKTPPNDFLYPYVSLSFRHASLFFS